MNTLSLRKVTSGATVSTTENDASAKADAFSVIGNTQIFKFYLLRRID